MRRISNCKFYTYKVFNSIKSSRNAIAEYNAKGLKFFKNYNYCLKNTWASRSLTIQPLTNRLKNQVLFLRPEKRHQRMRMSTVVYRRSILQCVPTLPEQSPQKLQPTLQTHMNQMMLLRHKKPTWAFRTQPLNRQLQTAMKRPQTVNSLSISASL